MSKAFTRENDSDLDEELEGAPPLPVGTRNYMTPGGFARLKAELALLVERERPEIVATVAWAASNGDRSENGDYIYGKKRLREVDRRIRFLIRRLDNAEVVDPLARRDSDNADQIFFGATVTVCNQRGEQRTVSMIVRSICLISSSLIGRASLLRPANRPATASLSSLRICVVAAPTCFRLRAN